MSSSHASCCLSLVKKQKHEFHFFGSMYNNTIFRFGFCDIQNNQGLGLPSLQTQTYFWLSFVSAENNVCKPEPGNNFFDVGILSQSQFSSSSPRTTPRGIRCKEHSSFILSWNLIGQRETKVVTSQKSFPCSGLQTLFSAETSDSRIYVCIRRLRSTLPYLNLDYSGYHKDLIQ